MISKVQCLKFFRHDSSLLARSVGTDRKGTCRCAQRRLAEKNRQPVFFLSVLIGRVIFLAGVLLALASVVCDVLSARHYEAFGSGQRTLQSRLTVR